VFLTIGSLTSATFAQQTVAGLASGGIYASLAVALVLIYRATEVINFAQGAMAMFTTYIAFQLMQWGLSYWPAFVATLAIAFVGGIATERIVIRPVEHAGTITIVIITIGLLILLEGLASWILTPEIKTFPSAFSTRGIHVGAVTFSLQDLGTIGISIGAVVVLWLFFQFTKVGLAMRAAALRPAAARLVGVRVSWMLALGWGIAAAVVGGIENPFGAVVGGLALGVLLNLLGTYVHFVTSELRLPVALAILLGVIVIRPAGLFGRQVVRRV